VVIHGSSSALITPTTLEFLVKRKNPSSLSSPNKEIALSWPRKTIKLLEMVPFGSPMIRDRIKFIVACLRSGDTSDWYGIADSYFPRSKIMIHGLLKGE
jgi:hypothetical protein